MFIIKPKYIMEKTVHTTHVTIIRLYDKYRDLFGKCWYSISESISGLVLNQ